ncbi:MAG: conjugal transfer protein TraF [Planctomycetota bacterium]
MKKFKWFVLSVALISIIVGSALQVSAEDWAIYGPRAEGMGGAGVAMADGATAHYWNPGATSKNDKSGLYIAFGLDTSAEGDILQSVDKLSSKSGNVIPILTKVDAGTSLTATEAKALLDFFAIASTELNKPGQGMLVNSAGGIGFAIGKLTIFGNGLAYGSLDPVADNTHLSLNTGPSAVTNTVGTTNPIAPSNTTLASQIAAESWWIAGSGNASVQARQLVYLLEQSGQNSSDPEVQQFIRTVAQNIAGGSAANSVSNNTSGVTIRGLVLQEIGVSYSRPILDNLSVGANLKMMEGTTYYNYVSYKQLESSEDMISDITSKKNTKTSSAFGLDVGGLMNLTDKLRVGLTIKNINKPKFSATGGDIELDPQTRAGVAMDVLPNFLVVAADYDVTKNKSTILQGYESQMFALGAEINLIGFLKFRAGTSRNLATSAKALTGGLRINLVLLSLDLAVIYSSDNVKTENTAGGGEIPQKFGGSLSLAIRF